MNFLSNNPAPSGAQQLLRMLLIFAAISLTVSSSISSESAAVGTQTTADAAFSSKLINEFNSTSGRSAPQIYHEESATIRWKTVKSQNPTELGPGVAVKTAKCTFEHQKTFTNINRPAGLFGWTSGFALAPFRKIFSETCGTAAEKFCNAYRIFFPLVVVAPVSTGRSGAAERLSSVFFRFGRFCC